MSAGNVTNVVITVALVGLVMYRQVKQRQLSTRSLLAIPLILVVIGVIDVNGAVTRNGGSYTGTDAAFLALDMSVTIALGLLRGTTVHLFERDGYLWRQGTWITATVWGISLAARIAIGIIAAHHGAKAIASSELLLSLGVSLGSQGLLLYVRGQRTGIPFAPSPRDRSRSHY